MPTTLDDIIRLIRDNGWQFTLALIAVMGGLYMALKFIPLVYSQHDEQKALLQSTASYMKGVCKSVAKPEFQSFCEP